MATKKKPTVSVVWEHKFTKEEWVNAKVFRDRRDVVSAVLEDGVEYTISDVETMIANYMKGMVK